MLVSFGTLLLHHAPQDGGVGSKRTDQVRTGSEVVEVETDGGLPVHRYMPKHPTLKIDQMTVGGTQA
mgnify:CR=1 FL=1